MQICRHPERTYLSTENLSKVARVLAYISFSVAVVAVAILFAPVTIPVLGALSGYAFYVAVSAGVLTLILATTSFVAAKHRSPESMPILPSTPKRHREVVEQESPFLGVLESPTAEEEMNTLSVFRIKNGPRLTLFKVNRLNNDHHFHFAHPFCTLHAQDGLRIETLKLELTRLANAFIASTFNVELTATLLPWSVEVQDKVFDTYYARQNLFNLQNQNFILETLHCLLLLKALQLTKAPSLSFAATSSQKAFHNFICHAKRELNIREHLLCKYDPTGSNTADLLTQLKLDIM